jgi:hypothetical protein
LTQRQNLQPQENNSSLFRLLISCHLGLVFFWFRLVMSCSNLYILALVWLKVGSQFHIRFQSLSSGIANHGKLPLP